MALSKLLARRLPEPPAEAPGVQGIIAQALAMPQLVPLREFWQNLAGLRPWWPVLLPLLLWIGWRTYRRERAEVLAQRALALPGDAAPPA